jgi:hypothetical protein
MNEEEKMKKIMTLILVMFVVTASLSFAQEKGKFGFIMRVDPSPRIGITYHISGKFALRPYFGFSKGTETSDVVIEPERLPPRPERTGTREEDTTRISFGLGLLYSVYSVRHFTAYTGINFGYTSENSDVSFSWRDDDVSNKGEILSGNIMFGLQANIMKNLSIFGEVGFGYSQGDFDHVNNVDLKSKQTRWGLTNSGIGLAFYF